MKTKVYRKKHTEVKGQIPLTALYISQIRSKKGYTQDDMARIVHVSRGTLASYENFRRGIPTEIIQKIEKQEEKNKKWQERMSANTIKGSGN